jgi:hypothetical protein
MGLMLNRKNFADTGSELLPRGLCAATFQAGGVALVTGLMAGDTKPIRNLLTVEAAGAHRDLTTRAGRLGGGGQQMVGTWVKRAMPLFLLVFLARRPACLHRT